MYLIDLISSELKSVFDIPDDSEKSYYNNYVAVHNSDCRKIWLFSLKDNGFTKYIISETGIAKEEDYFFSPSEYNMGNEKNCWLLKFSRDCKYYTFSNFKFDNSKNNYVDIYYGFFDLQTGCFYRKSSYTFADCKHINGSIISPDNSKIYVSVCKRHENGIYYDDIIEIPIIGEIPDYNVQKIVYSKMHRMYILGDMLYGMDGRIYILDYACHEVSCLYINDNGDTECENILKNWKYSSEYKPWFVSTFFSDKSCRCYDMKRIKIIYE